MIHDSLIDAFELLSRARDDDPDGLTEAQQRTWRRLRNQIEQHLFQRSISEEADRREHLRVPVYLTVGYWSDQELRDRLVDDLGEGGLFVPTAEPLDPGERLQLRIAVATRGLSLVLEGQVAWANRGEDLSSRGMGIAFVNLNDFQRDALRQLIREAMHEGLFSPGPNAPDAEA